jgi:flagellum-specific peptidoglycan hydrolase FlgJ/LysM repeat protein
VETNKLSNQKTMNHPLFKKNVFVLFFLLSTILVKGQTEKHKIYIEQFYPIAVAEMERANIPASIKLAQGILESGLGESELAKNANNHFGIKCGNDWIGEGYYLKDDDRNDVGILVKSCFRVFDSSEESYVAHTEFLMNPKKVARYGFLFEYERTDYKSWAKGLKDAGYATNPNYPNLLISVIERNDLTKYDNMTTANLDPIFVQNYPNKREELSNRKYTKISNFNGIRSVFAKEGDTPSDISVKFGTATRLIVNYNEIDGIRIFEENERVFLQNKKWKYKGNTKTHRVQEGESMYDIAQNYGIRTQWLYIRNLMKAGEEPASGEQLNLRGWNFKGVKILPKGKTTQGNTPTNTTEPTDNNDADDGFLDEVVPPSAQKITHVVQKGESLYGIAQKYGVTVDKIKELNNLETNNLNIGQELIIK